MALLDCDSFDWYTTAADGGWAIAGGGGITSGGRTGNRLYVQASWSGGFDGNATRTLAGSASEVHVGAAVMIGHAVSNAPWFFVLQEGGTVHLYLTMNSSGLLELRNGAGTLVATGTTVITASTWFHLQMRAKIHDSTGLAEVKINNAAAEINVSGIDTRNGGTGVVNALRMSNGQVTFEGAWNAYMDDLWVTDTTGSSNTGYLGDCSVPYLPAEGNGNSSQFVGSDGNSTDNYLLVDDTASDGDSTYVESATLGHKDTYVVDDLAAPTGSVKGVRILPFAKKNDAGTRTIVSVARLSSTEEDGPAKTLTTSYASHSDIRETKPGGGAWTLSDVNSAEFGIKVNS